MLGPEYKWNEVLAAKKDGYWTGKAQPGLTQEELQFLMRSSSEDELLESKR